MFILSLGRAFKFAWQNFWRNFWLSLVTVFILILTLLSISLVTSVNLIADNAIKAIKEKVDVDVFFKQQVAEGDVLETKSFLEQLPTVKSVAYISQEQALEDFKNEHANDDKIQSSLGELGENPLPASLVIKANDLQDYPKISKALEESDFNKFIEGKDFEDNRVVIEKLSQVTERMYQIGLIVSGVFVLIAVLVIFNTIRINIYTYREELGIMRLVGANNVFIRGPFMLDSLFYAVFASLISTGILYPTMRSATPFVNSLFEGYNFDLFQFFMSNLWIIFGVQLAASLLLCMVSSMVAIGRYLKV